MVPQPVMVPHPGTFAPPGCPHRRGCGRRRRPSRLAFPGSAWPFPQSGPPADLRASPRDPRRPMPPYRAGSPAYPRACPAQPAIRAAGYPAGLATRRRWVSGGGWLSGGAGYPAGAATRRSAATRWARLMCRLSAYRAEPDCPGTPRVSEQPPHLRCPPHLNASWASDAPGEPDAPRYEGPGSMSRPCGLRGAAGHMRHSPPMWRRWCMRRLRCTLRRRGSTGLPGRTATARRA